MTLPVACRASKAPRGRGRGNTCSVDNGPAFPHSDRRRSLFVRFADRHWSDGLTSMSAPHRLRMTGTMTREIQRHAPVRAIGHGSSVPSASDVARLARATALRRSSPSDLAAQVTALKARHLGSSGA